MPRGATDAGGDDATIQLDGTAPTDASWAPGQRRGRYVILEELGSGGMGTVLEAYDPKLERKVAIKVLRPRLFDDNAAARLVREAQSMAQLSHPNVVAVFDVEHGDDGVAIAMELVAGETLRQWCKLEHPWREVVQILVAAGRGLAAAHEVGLVHRDFKPANVLMGADGRPRVTDFGLARGVGGTRSLAAESDAAGDSMATADVSLTEAGKVMGTPAYMAPEQHAGREVDARGDQYAFCVTLWEALCGTRPFTGSADALPKKKREGPPKWPASAPGVPHRIVDAIRRGLAPDPEARWPSMPELLDALERGLTRRRRAVASLGAVAAIGVGIAVGRLGFADAAAPCEPAEDPLADAWSYEVRQRVEGAFTAADVPYAADATATTLDALDRYAEGWRTAFVDACEATRVRQEQSEELMDRRMICLGERRRALRSVADVLSTADASVVERSANLVASLPALEGCADLDPLLAGLAPPSDPETRAAVDEVRDLIADSEARRVAGQYDTAIEPVESAISRAEALDYRPVLAEAVLVRGRIANDVNDLETAEPGLERAYTLGLEVGHDDVAAYAAAGLAFLVGNRLERPGEGMVWGKTALALARRYDPGGRAEAYAYNNLCGMHLTAGHFETAERHCREALRLRERLFAPDNPDIAGVVTNLGNVMNMQGKFAEAVELQRRALAIREHAHGPKHPLVALAAHNLAAALFQLGELDEAETIEERALEIWGASLGPDSHYYAIALTNLGAIAGTRENHAEAIEHYRKALEIWEHEGAESLGNATNAKTNLALSYESLGRLDEAEKLHRAVLALREAGGWHPNLVTSVAGLARLLMRRGELEEAAELTARARALADDKFPEGHPHQETVAELERDLADARARADPAP